MKKFNLDYLIDQKPDGTTSKFKVDFFNILIVFLNTIISSGIFVLIKNKINHEH